MSTRFSEFLKKLPSRDREMFLMLRMYEQSCDDLGSSCDLVESQILKTYTRVQKEKESIITAIQKLDEEFDQKLGKWAESESDSDSCDCSDCCKSEESIPDL